MIRFKSIMSRIVVLHVVAVVVTAIMMPLILYLFMSSAVKTLHQSAMREHAEWLGSHLHRAPSGVWTLALPDELDDLFSEAYGRYVYAVLDGGGNVLLASGESRLPLFPVRDAQAEVEFLETRHGSRILATASVRKVRGGQVVFVQLGEDLTHRDVLLDDVVASFLQQVGWIIVPILLLLLAADILIVRHAVQPLVRASAQARDISPTRIDLRLPTDDIPREILPLVIAVNQALDRLEQGFRRQREFAADAAHELRTPLAVLRTRIDTLPDPKAAQALQHDIEGMSRVVGQLLDLAEVEALAVDPDEKADLRQVCAEVAEFLVPLALTHGKSIALGGAEGPAWVAGNAEMLRRAVRNLVENALHHTPPATAVEIVVGRDGTVRVLDAGEGVSAAERELIFQRFWRRDRRRIGGAGLGLSIVRRIVTAHGGTIAVANRPAGGAAFTMQLVPAPPPAVGAKPPAAAAQDRDEPVLAVKL